MLRQCLSLLCGFLGLTQMTRRKLLIAGGAILLVAVLGILFAPWTTEPSPEALFAKHRINNLRQIFLASFQMGTDGTVAGNALLGYPGDLATRQPPVQTVSDYLRRLIEHGFLTERDVEKITDTPGGKGWTSAEPDADKHCAFKIYRFSESDPPRTIALASRNFTYGRLPEPKPNLKHEETIIVVDKAGNGALYKRHQLSNWKAIGLLPGRRDANDRPVETPEDTLIQR